MIYKIAGSSSAVVLFIDLLEMSKELVSYIMINNQPSQILIDPDRDNRIFSMLCVLHVFQWDQGEPTVSLWTARF